MSDEQVERPANAVADRLVTSDKLADVDLPRCACLPPSQLLLRGVATTA